MKCVRNLFATLLLALLAAPMIHGQTFDEALELYENENFEEASELFISLDGDEALLFAGKSNLALGNYLIAGIFLHQAMESDNAEIANEAIYTAALTLFKQKNYSRSLELLKELEGAADRTGLRSEAENLYEDILQYLSDGERFRIFQQVTRFDIRADLIRSAIHRVDYSLLRTMLLELERIASVDGDMEVVRLLREEIGTPESYMAQPFQQIRTPQGMVYHIGVALPSFEADEPEFEIPRNLYFGITLAAEEFNSRNADKKVLLRFKDTQSNPDVIPWLVQEMVWNDHVDAVIGPLFSDTAARMSELARTYELPMIAPLANSDNINTGHPYTYQLNPTFAVHGRNMARFAVNDLNLDTLAVITESGSLGNASAQAFRREAESLGAHVAYFFDVDFAAGAYDISDYTEVFIPDQELADSLGFIPVKGIYAPFTGQASQTLTNLLMNDLEAMRTDLVLMGSQEWRDIQFTNWQLQNFRIYYSEPATPEADTTALEYFEEDFTIRFGFEPDNFSRIGYDTGNFLFRTLEESGNPALLKDALQNSGLYEGLALRIQFEGTLINQSVQIRALTERARIQMESHGVVYR